MPTKSWPISSYSSAEEFKAGGEHREVFHHLP